MEAEVLYTPSKGSVSRTAGVSRATAKLEQTAGLTNSKRIMVHVRKPTVSPHGIATILHRLLRAATWDTFTDGAWGRFAGAARLRHTIKRAECLLGDRHLQQGARSIYAASCRVTLARIREPVMLID